MDKIYITENGYFFCYETGKMFKPSEELGQLLRNTKNLEELYAKYLGKEIPEELYQRLRILLINEGYNDAETGRKKQIGKLQFIVTNNCNMRCKYCYAHAGTYNQIRQSMSFDTAKRAIDIFFEKYEYIQYISFFGGEPLLNIELINRVCNYVKRKYRGRFSAFMMMSNLLILDKEACNVIKKHKIRLTSSLDGNEICNDKNRIDVEGKGTYERVAENIAKLRKIANQPEAIEATLTKVNRDNEMNPLKLAHYFYEQFGITCSSGVVARIYDDNVEAYVAKERTTIQEYLDAYIDQGLITEQVKNFLLLIQGKQMTGTFCDAGLGQFTVMQNGDIFPCQMFAMVPNKKYCMGNVNEDYNIDDKIEEIQKELLNYSREKIKKCNGCKLRNSCSKCVADILYKNNKFVLDEWACENFLDETNTYIECYSKLYADKVRWKQFLDRVAADNELWKKI